jgi:hypothetical protein
MCKLRRRCPERRHNSHSPHAPGAGPSPGPSRAIVPPRPLQADILRHASAQRRQASAQLLQCAISCAPHSFAHQSQMSAHSLQSCLANGLWRAIASQQSRQIAAHSTQHEGQAFVLAMPDMCAKQWPHSVAQLLHAAMQSLAAWSKCSLMLSLLRLWPDERGAHVAVHVPAALALSANMSETPIFPEFNVRG